MREYPFAIIDIHGQAWPYMLDVDQPVHYLLPNLAQSLGMPRELNYVLLPRGSDRPLDPRHTLAEMRIPPRAELELRPLRDYLLKQFLDKLYDEVKDQIKDKLIDLAKEKLRKILDIDPYYPDPLHLREQLWGAAPDQAPHQYQHAQQQPKPGSKIGWIIGGILGGGALLAAAGILAAIVLAKWWITPTDDPDNPPVLGTGDVQVTLRWSAPVDLDLHVIDPAGEEVWFRNRTSSSGGNLDVDANSNCYEMMSQPVENVYWPYGSAPDGQYRVAVAYYMNCGYSGPVDYEITIRRNNQIVDVLNGTLKEAGESLVVTEFNR